MQNYKQTNFRSRRLAVKPESGGKGPVFLLGIIILIFTIFFFRYRASPAVTQTENSKPEALGIEAVTNPISEIFPSPSPSAVINSKSLQDAVDKSLEGTLGTYGIYVKNLKTGESYSYNDNHEFESGSLYKLWTMAVVMSEIEKGNLDEDEELSQSIAALNRKFGIDPSLAEQTSGTITLTVNQALTQMITISHNYAALLLTEKVKLSSVANWLEEKGFKNSKVGTAGDAPTTTPLDIALFFEKLYNGELGNSESTEKMINLLKAQQLNNKLPLNLPEGVVIAHKTGELGWFSHDSGIVYSPKGDYIIVAMSESSSPKGAEDRIASLSEAVYNYFQNK